MKYRSRTWLKKNGNKLLSVSWWKVSLLYSCSILSLLIPFSLCSIILQLNSEPKKDPQCRRVVNHRKLGISRHEVIDNGPGIPQEKLKNIWDRYYKVDKSHKSAKIGTGLGLSIVKTVLKLHRAQYGVFSKVGKGTVFWFELYRTTEDGEPM